MQNWKAILQSNRFYFGILLITFIVVFVSFFVPRKSEHSLGAVTIEGKVIDYKIDGNFLSMIVEAQEKVQTFYYFQTEEKKLYFLEHLGYGTTVKVEGIMESPESNSIPNTFNYQEYLYYQNITRILNADFIEITEKAHGIYVFKNSLYQYLYHKKYGDYLLAMVLGNTDYLDHSMVRQNGISHLFAISGMQITLFAKILSKLLKRFGSKKEIGIFFLLWFYAFLVGFTPSVLRAVLFWSYQQFNRKFQLKLSRNQIFVFVLCTVLFFQPFAVMDLGFQYSFLISFVLMQMHFHKNYLKSSLQISVVSFLVSLPITASNFYSVNVLSIIWNLFFVPFVSFVFYPCCFLSLLFPFMEWLLGWCITIFECVNVWCASVSFGMLVLPKVSLVWWVFYSVLLGLCFYKKKVSYFIFLIIFLLILKYQVKFSNHAYVYFLDVGQGDASVFISPHQQKVILIDTGGKITYHQEEWEVRSQRIDQGETIKTFLNSLGISKIDIMVLSHGDVDHAGNALSLLQQMEVSQIVMNRNSKNALEKEIEGEYSQKVEDSISSEFFQIEDFTIDKVYDENDASLVLKISIYGNSFLMTGDISQNIEKKLLNENIQSTVLKVAHHGSSTSTSMAFVKKIKPSYAIISVGENNLYGHPSIRTIETLEKVGVPYFLTSQDKTIWFEITDKWMKAFHLQ